jgi:PHD/YefM family antitoxin component YafN of YafNO toxin-antitoxin module
LIITQNGEAKAVVQDVASYEQAQETLALLKILALGRAEADAGKSVSLQEVRRRFASKGTG